MENSGKWAPFIYRFLVEGEWEQRVKDVLRLFGAKQSVRTFTLL